jgi:hypothetical protein
MAHGAIDHAAHDDEVHVLATSLEGTRAALQTAIPLARGSRSRLIVIVTQVVPFDIARQPPADATNATMRRYRDLVADMDGEAQLRLCLCRKLQDATLLLPRRAVVVVGGASGGLIPSLEMKLVKGMTRLGHTVVFVPTRPQA